MENSNLGINNCKELNNENNCVFKFNQNPTFNNNEFIILNKLGIKPNPCFYSINCPNSSYCTNLYISHDPRLLDVRRNILTKLDRPPLEGNTLLQDVYNIRNSKLYYSDYNNINTGQIQYYVDKSISEPFYDPSFNIPSYNIGTLYKDPMDSIKPQYERIPIINKKDGYNTYSCLTWINDSSEFREDIMSKQQRKNNQQKYSARWY